jgi:uncharacterized protein (UPF0332 family)
MIPMEKARESLSAAHALMENGYFDSVASRAYYSVYLGAWHKLDCIAIPPDAERNGNRFWRHDRFPGNLTHYLRIDEDLEEQLEWLYQLRLKADYFAESVPLEDASHCLECAESLWTFFDR